MTDVFTLKWSFGGPQHVRSYTAWPNRARGSFSQRFRSFDPKVRSGPTEPRYYVYSCSPPYLNAFERYFLDYRMQKGFDAGLPMHGMLVWHITYDKTAWSKNELNVLDLQRVDLIEADGKGNQPSRWGYKQGTYEGDPFSGNERKTSINNFALWSGESLGVSLSEITETDSSVKFKIAYSSGSLVFLSSSSEAMSSSSEVLYSSNSVVESSSSVGLESSSSAEEPSTSSSESFDLVRKNIYGEPELNVLSRERFYDLKGRRVSAPKNH